MQNVFYPEIRKEAVLPVYVTGVGLEYARPPFDTADRILLTLSGHADLDIGGQTQELKAGTLVYLRSGEPYEISVQDREWRANWVSFLYNGSRLPLITDGEHAIFQLSAWNDASLLIRSIYDALLKDGEFGGYTASSVLYTLLIRLHREANAIPVREMVINPAIAAVIAHIDKHCTEELTLEVLCKAAGGLSEQYLCRLFKQATGMRPMEYILKKRIAIAQEYLEKTDLPITDIARKSGFHNTSYFYRNFKKFTGTSPLSCRQNAVALRG